MTFPLSFYHLEKEPFNITPDPDFLVSIPGSREALASLIYGVENKKGFIVVTGEVGVGKTTILRSFMKRADNAHLKIAYILQSNVAFKELLKAIFRELDAPFGTDDVSEMVNRFHQLLIEEYRQGNNVALIVDEAQNMPIETLENLRMLSNLETSTEKLLQIVLVGQPELEQMLDLRELRQLKQRIAIRCIIHPLTEKESLAYIRYRLAKVATSDSPVFTRGALRTIVRKANGIPRILNILCSNALITGLGYQVRPVNARIAQEVIEDFYGEKGERRFPLLPWVVASAAILLVTTGFLWFSPSHELSVDWHKIVSGIEDRPAQKEESLLLGSSASSEYYFPIKSEIEPALQEEAMGVSRKEILRLQNELSPKIRVMAEGDSLYRLAKEVYGFTNPRLIHLIKQSNPEIKNVNKIRAGMRILFPKIDGTKRD